jgi:8-oxo-dGTP pyrophosphatase MutT (NUDIX family)
MEYPRTILTRREGFRDLIIKNLARTPHNFLAQHDYIKEEKKKGIAYDTSGVLLLLRFDEETSRYEFVLTKRSPHVVQPGDLSCPGGHVSPMDTVIGFLISSGLFPRIRGEGISVEKRSMGKRGFRIAADYLATALREAKEETGLRPGAVEYLGSLSTYGLVSFRRVIYPLVGAVTGPWEERLNWEVEKIVPVPIQDMLDAENYYWLFFDVPEDIRRASARRDWNFPAFVLDHDGQREVLWGATLNIIVSFLKIVLGFALPDIPEGKYTEKEIPENYFTGRFKKAITDGLRRERKKT